MNDSENFGDDWRMLMAVHEQEQRMEQVLKQVHTELVPGKVSENDFKELVCLTGLRVKAQRTKTSPYQDRRDEE